MKKVRSFIYLLFVCAVLMMTVPVSAALQISPTSANLVKGNTKVLKIATTNKVTWSIKNNGVLSVVSKAQKSIKIKALKKGTGYVYATVKGKKYTSKIRVYNVGELLTKTYTAVGKDYIMIASADGSSTSYSNILPYHLSFPPAGYEDYFIPAEVGLHITTKTDAGYNNPVYWIYVDRKLIEKKSIPYGYDGSIKRSNAASTKGIHTVEILRYKNGKPSNAPVLYKKLRYRIIPE